MEKEVDEKVKQILENMRVNLEDIKNEQLKLRKGLELKDSINPEEVNLIAGCDNAYFDNSIISAIVIVDKNFEIIEEKFAVGKARFPYISGYLSYRELPIMMDCYKKLENVPDVLIVDGNGILHPREFGLASHFGLSINKPTIGVAKNLMLGEIKKDDVFVGKKVLAKQIITKEGSKPIFVSQGNKISLNSAVEITKKLINLPHKLPEPLFLAHHYADKIRKELSRTAGN